MHIRMARTSWLIRYKWSSTVFTSIFVIKTYRSLKSKIFLCAVILLVCLNFIWMKFNVQINFKFGNWRVHTLKSICSIQIFFLSFGSCWFRQCLTASHSTQINGCYYGCEELCTDIFCINLSSRNIMVLHICTNFVIKYKL